MNREQSPINQLDKISRLREQLKGRGDVFIAGEVTHSHGLTFRGFYEYVEIYVSPIELIGRAPSLKRFANGLTDLRTKIEGGYTHSGGSYLQVPRLSLSEVIGTETRKMSRMLRVEGAEIYDTYEEVEAEVKRGITVRVYPHPEIAKLVYAYKAGLQTGAVTESDEELDHLVKEVSLEAIEQLKQGQDPFEELRQWV